jgi:hypothetical protein
VPPEHSTRHVRNKRVVASPCAALIGGFRAKRDGPLEAQIGSVGKHVERLRGRAVEGEKQRDRRIARERELVVLGYNGDMTKELL